MKVKELISKLSKLNPEMTVVCRGFDEEGYADIQVVNQVKVQLRKSQSAREMIGEYEEPSGEDIIEAILVDHT